MATTTSAAKNSRPSSIAKSYAAVQEVRAEVENLIKSHFSATLGSIPDVVKLVMACIYKESSFNPRANSGVHGEPQLKKFLGFSAIMAKVRDIKTTAQEKTNMRNAVAGFGLMQATGWYLIKGAGPSGQTELSRMRSDLAADLIVEPGVDINTKLGPDKISNQIKAGLIILEDKFKNASSLVSNPPTVNKPYTTKVMATFGSYLGKGTDKFGSTPQDYAASIIHGEAYALANGGRLTSGATIPISNDESGPNTSTASGRNLGPAGC